MQWQIQNFPLGGADPLGGTNLRRRHVLVKMYVKMKELTKSTQLSGAKVNNMNDERGLRCDKD